MDKEFAPLFVRDKSLFGSLLILRTLTTIVSVRIDTDSPTRSEDSCHLNILRIHEFNEVLHDSIHTVFMEITMITEAKKIEFKTLTLNHSLARDV